MKNDSALQLFYKSIVGTVVIIAILSLISAFCLSRVTRSVLRPEIDHNIQSYLLLTEAVESGNYSTLKALSDQAHVITRDEDIQKLADLLSRVADLNLQIGVKTFQEADSFEGFTKGFIAGLINPMLSVRSLGLSLDMWLADADTLGQNIDARYLPKLNAYSRANSVSGIVFWLILLGMFVFLIHRRQYVRNTLDRLVGEKLYNQLSPNHEIDI